LKVKEYNLPEFWYLPKTYTSQGRRQ